MTQQHRHSLLDTDRPHTRFLDAGDDETHRLLSWLASKKRQGTKSREVGHRLGSGRYGDLIRALSLVVNVMQGGWDLWMDVQATSRTYDGHLRASSECVNGHSAH